MKEGGNGGIGGLRADADWLAKMSAYNGLTRIKALPIRCQAHTTTHYEGPVLRRKQTVRLWDERRELRDCARYILAGRAGVIDRHGSMTPTPPKRFRFNIAEIPQEFGWSVGNDRMHRHSRLAV